MLATHVLTFTRVMRFVPEKADVSHLEDLIVTSLCFLCAHISFVALPSMLLTWVVLHSDPTHPERKMKLSPYFVIFLLPRMLYSEVQLQRARPVYNPLG